MAHFLHLVACYVKCNVALAYGLRRWRPKIGRKFSIYGEREEARVSEVIEEVEGEPLAGRMWFTRVSRVGLP